METTSVDRLFCKRMGRAEKFLQHEELRNKLSQTGNKRLAELNWWGDEWFGVNCRTKKGKIF